MTESHGSDSSSGPAARPDGLDSAAALMELILASSVHAAELTAHSRTTDVPLYLAVREARPT